MSSLFNDVSRYFKIPEPPIDPPEDRSVTADCGHEVYEGENLFEWEGGRTLCPDCMEEKFDELTLPEKAALLGCNFKEVIFHEL